MPTRSLLAGPPRPPTPLAHTHLANDHLDGAVRPAPHHPLGVSFRVPLPLLCAHLIVSGHLTVSPIMLTSFVSLYTHTPATVSLLLLPTPAPRHPLPRGISLRTPFPPLHAYLIVSSHLATYPSVLTSLISLYARTPATIPLLLHPYSAPFSPVQHLPPCSSSSRSTHLIVSGRLTVSHAALTFLVSLYAHPPAALQAAVPLLLLPASTPPPLCAILSHVSPPFALLFLLLHAHLIVAGRLAALTSLVSLYAHAPTMLQAAVPLLLVPAFALPPLPLPLPCLNAALFLPHTPSSPMRRHLLRQALRAHRRRRYDGGGYGGGGGGRGSSDDGGGGGAGRRTRRSNSRGGREGENGWRKKRWEWATCQWEKK